MKIPKLPRRLIHRAYEAFSGIHRSFRLFFFEHVPSPWQRLSTRGGKCTGHYDRRLAIDPLERRVMLDVTISGTISYQLDQVQANPVRNAYVTVSGLAGLLPVSAWAYTDTLGHYQAVLPDYGMDVSGVSLNVKLQGAFDGLTGEPAFTINQPNGPGGTAGDIYTWFKSGGGTVAAGGSKTFIES